MREIEDVTMLIILIMIAVIDIRRRKISVRLLTVLTLAVLLYRVIYRTYDIWQYACGMLLGFIFLGISFITRQALGYGDSWMILILGSYLGIWDVTMLLMTAFFLAAVFSGVCLARDELTGAFLIPARMGGMNQRKKSFPFIPILALSYLGVVLL